ncbi:hypothetical protein C0J52_05971 [Blattella germanica]|nr:hypothetical protein C0J52_05971 [Blattella germanica]
MADSGGTGESAPASRWRVALPQVLASTAKNLILLDLGMTIAFPTIVIPALQNSKGVLGLTDEQTSWFGSIAYICQPLGSVLSGVVLEHLGRKKSMILVNIPHLIGWLMFYFGNSVELLYVASVIMGLGVGFMEAPIITYVGEISQPELRGVLTSYSVSTWRMAALISAFVPIVTVLAISQVPETPIWLLSRGRVEEAEKSLCWLRGWVKPNAVKKELEELTRYTENMKSLKLADAQNGSSNSCMRKIRDLVRPQTFRPLTLVIMFFFFQHWSGFSAMRPYMVKVFEEFGLPVDGHWTTVITGVIGIIGNIVCMVGVPWWGKRPISLVSMAASCMSCIILGAYAFVVILPGEVATAGTRDIASWLPMLVFVVLVFVQSVGVLPIPWMILSEVFPFRSRGLASGIAAAASYIIAFVASKTFLGIKSSLHLHGVFFLYGLMALLGFILIYFTFVETEGRSLEDIEEFYKKGIKGTIPKMSKDAPQTKESSLNLCSATNPVMAEKGLTNVGFDAGDEDHMVENTLYRNHTDAIPVSRNGDHRMNGKTEDTSFIVSADTPNETSTVSESAVPQVPKKRKAPGYKEKGVSNGKSRQENEILPADGENAVEEAVAKVDVIVENGFTHEEEGKEECKATQDDSDKHEPEDLSTAKSVKSSPELVKENGECTKVNIIHEKADVHSDAEVEERTQM